MSFSSNPAKQGLDSQGNQTSAKSDSSLNKAKLANPFKPHGLKKSFTSEATPFVPAASQTASKVTSLSSSFSPLYSTHSTFPSQPQGELVMEGNINMGINGSLSVAPNDPFYMEQVPPINLSQTIFVSPQLPIYCATHMKKMLAQEAPDDPRYKQIPQRYHSMKVLDKSGMEMVTGSFGYLTSLYKVVDSKDGNCYALRRVERVRTNNDMNTVLSRWSKIRHSSIVSLHECFLANGAVFFAHEYCPSAISLYDRYLKNANPSSTPIVEDVLWCILLQLLSAIQFIHANNLAARVVDYKHILETTRNRVKIGSAGVLDLLEPRTNISELQVKDLQQLGYMMMVLGSRGCAKIDLQCLAVRYSEHYVNIVKMLLNGEMAAQTVMEKCTNQLLRTGNSAMATNDYYLAALSQEYANGRFLRLMMKLMLVYERLNENSSISWSDTNDSHIIRLFCDYVFHQKDEQLHSVFEYGKIIDSLAKLDAGEQESIQLCSADGKTMLVCTFEDIKQSLDNLYGEIIAQSNPLLFGREMSFHSYIMVNQSSPMSSMAVNPNQPAGPPMMSTSIDFAPFASTPEVDQRGFLPNRSQQPMIRQSWI